MKPVVIDTSALIEWLRDTPLAQQLAAHFPPREQMIIPTMVQLELSKWMRREISEDAARDAIAWTMMAAVAPLDTRIAIAAGRLSVELKLANADAVIYATAVENDAALLTCDAHFAGLPQVTLIAKGA